MSDAVQLENLGQKIVIPAFVAILTCLGTLGTAWFMFKGQQGATDVRMVQVAYERMESLDKRLIEANTQVVKLRARIMELEARLEREVNIDGFLEEFIDSFPFPAWIKYVDTDADGKMIFPMAVINKAYEHQHGVSKRRYAGNQDKDIWPPKVAEAFREHDLEVLRNKSAGTYTESYPKNPWAPVSSSNPTIEWIVVKVHLRFFDKQEMIFGMAVKAK